MEFLKNPIICAADTTDMERARQLCNDLQGQIGAIKLGLEFFTAHGPQGVRHLSQDMHLPIFLDLKLHDIPNTVARAVAATSELNVFMMTVHVSGGEEMLKAAVEASEEIAERTGQHRPMIIGVTVLTSMDRGDLSGVGIDCEVRDQVLRLAGLAQKCSLDGVVCSPHEITAIREECGDSLKLVVPGIRPSGSDNGDQKRVLTPNEALAKGADYLVIGRPITQAESPREAARSIAATL